MSTTVETLNFIHIKTAVARQFERMQRYQMFRVELAGRNELVDAYLAAFPPGTNPIFRERTEHDCACCRAFIRAVGDVVAVVDGELTSIWTVEIPEEPAYQAVVDRLSTVVLDKKIVAPFLSPERTAGTDKNHEDLGDGTVRTWNHFHVRIDPRYIADKHTIPTALGEARATHDVLVRGINELTLDAVDAALELIAQGSLYRGEEHTHALERFRQLKVMHAALPEAGRVLLEWMTVREHPAVARLRNTVIGTLVTDLSEGKDLEAAVKAFEAKVAPTNYKRPTALVTKAMVEKARATVAELGLTSALERRYARLTDLTVNNVLFADRGARRAMSADPFDALAREARDRVPRSLDDVEEVPVARFFTEVVPRAESLEVMLENRHAPNLVSLVAPVDPAAGALFRWPNNFSWSYAGEVADSIKERVKKAGGSVVGDLCCRLGWRNHDDLDLHMMEPRPTGGHIYFATHRGRHNNLSPHGGLLDVDMNAGSGQTREPVENIFYANRSRMRAGVYTLAVNQFAQRETKDVGFEVEVDWLGTVTRFAYDRALRTGETVVVAKMRCDPVAGTLEFVESLPSSQATKIAWGLPTMAFHRVAVALLSPNCWDGFDAGNRHYFFMLDGCANDGTARGFFNEFLRPGLDVHRKVFEILGSKMKVAPAAEQLSGLGFSSTQRNTLLCRVKGSFTRTIKIVF